MICTERPRFGGAGKEGDVRLYKQKAKNLVGKKIDRYRRLFGYYPMEIIEINGEYYVKDAVGVCMPIPEKETDFNCPEYDYVFMECNDGGDT